MVFPNNLIMCRRYRLFLQLLAKWQNSIQMNSNKVESSLKGQKKKMEEKTFF